MPPVITGGFFLDFYWQNLYNKLIFMISQIRGKQILLLIGDVLVMYLSLYFSLFLRFITTPGAASWNNHVDIFSMIFVVWILLFYVFGLYSLHSAINNSKFIESSLKVITLNFFIAVIYFYLFSFVGIAPKTILLIYFVVFVFFYFLWRFGYNAVLRSHAPRVNLAIIGCGEQVDEIITEIRRKPHLGYRVKLIFNYGEIINRSDGVVQVNGDAEFISEIRGLNIGEIIIAKGIRESEVTTLMFECLKMGKNLTSLTEFYEVIMGKIHLDLIDETWLVENFNRMNSQWFNAFKRCYDVALSLSILLLSLPIWPIIIFLIKFSSRGSVFFTQTRLGVNELPFTLIKFRTMSESDNDLSMTKREDPRITRIGTFLRKTRLDEIPQVLNVLKGDMSLIGPRPERPEFVRGLQKDVPFYNIRMLIKPGITGWDQISGEYHSPSAADTMKKLQNDFYYIKNRSLYLDISIGLKTIATVVSRGGR